MNDKNFFIRFIHANGMRPVIALVTIGGAIFITANGSTICVIEEQGQTSRENPACSRYFEMAALVLGGLLGLAVPSSVGEEKKQLGPKQGEKPQITEQPNEAEQPTGIPQFDQAIKDS
jgi:hypothetical protein